MHITMAAAVAAYRAGNDRGEGYAPYTDERGEDTVDAAVEAAQRVDGWELGRKVAGAAVSGTPAIPATVAFTATVTVGRRTEKVQVSGTYATEYGTYSFDALTPSGAGLARDEGPYAQRSRRLNTVRWCELRAALAARDPQAIVRAAARLPSVRVGLDSRTFHCSWRNWRLFEARVVQS